jgi:hypothetical protein
MMARRGPAHRTAVARDLETGVAMARLDDLPAAMAKRLAEVE